MSEGRRVLDVSEVPQIAFGSRTLLWWGTVSFILIEGITLAIMAVAYFYLRLNEYDWPPGHTPAPDLLIPTINTLWVVAIIWPMRAADRAAQSFDRAKLTRALTIATIMTAVAVALRWFELLALNARWDAHAYASAAWGLMVLHSTLLITDLFETGSVAVLFGTGPAQKKHYSDAVDAALYQYFLSLSTVVVYLIVYWGPRVL